MTTPGSWSGRTIRRETVKLATPAIEITTNSDSKLAGNGSRVSAWPAPTTEIEVATPAIAQRRPRRSNRPCGPAAPSITIGNATRPAVDGRAATAQTPRMTGIETLAGRSAAAMPITA